MATPADVPATPRRLLLVRLSALGDVVVSLSTLRCLRDALPRVEIDFAVQEELAPLLQGHPDLDGVVPVPIRHWRRLLTNPFCWFALAGELCAFAQRLGERRYDCVLDLHGNLKSGLISRMSGAPLRVGPAAGESREGNHLFMNARPKPPRSLRRHRCERALSLLEVLGIEPRDLPPLLPAYPRDFARAVLGDGGPPRRVLLHPGTSAGAAFKRWPVVHFGALARTLGKDGVRVLLVAGPGEEALLEEVRKAAAGAVEVLPIPPGLPELGGLLASVDLVVAADSGPACLADACGTPTVVLFGPKDPILYGPRNGVAVRLGIPCSPCGRRRCPLARVECMEDLDPAVVVEVVRSMLQGSIPPDVAESGRVRLRVEPHERDPR